MTVREDLTKEELRLRLEEAESILHAIAHSEVDAFVVQTSGSEQVYTLKGADQPYRIIVESISEGAATLGVDGTIFYCNQALAALLGQPLATVIGANLAEFVVTRDADRYVQLVSQGAAKQSKGEISLRSGAPNADASETPVLLSCSPLMLDEMQGVCIVATDLSEQHRQAEHLLQTRLRLEQEIALRENEERFRSVLEERVVERTAELERSNRELDHFAYVASHDLKAPLRAIDNLSKWIESDAAALLPHDSQEHLAKLRGRVHRMERLLDDLLAYSRAGRVQHAPERVATGDLVRSIFDLLSPPPEFQLIMEDPLPTLVTQRVPLETVLRNLMGNAIKHHQRNDGCIRVTARDMLNWVEFSIADDGPGIAPGFHERIFELFQTLQPRDQVEGSGMGLAIVKKTVESVGGHTAVEAAAGKGAVFRFTWPKG
jgi:PAS domain S-box-containing protein